jgi:DNA-binding NtrC family response regulator
VESKPGEGAVFTIELPLGAGPNAGSEAPPEVIAPAHRPLLLVVDDDPWVGNGLRRQLHNDFDIQTAGGVAVALESVARRPPEYILCDVVMPDGGAQRFIAELQKRHPELAARVVLITGGVTTPALTDFVASTNRPVIAKPLSRNRLAAALRSMDATGSD